MTIATPRTWVVGEVVTAAMMNAEVRDQWTDLISAWTPYTPVWSSTGTAPVLNNGSILGRYKLVGKTCTAVFEWNAGTTTTFGTGTYGWSLPFTAASPSSSSANWSWIGAARGHAAQWYHGAVAVTKGTSVARIYSHNAASEWSPTQPTTWAAAATNYLHAEIEYETV